MFKGLSRNQIFVTPGKTTGLDGVVSMNEKKERKIRAEYIIIGILFTGALLAFPAFRDVQILNDFVISICAGLGLT